MTGSGREARAGGVMRTCSALAARDGEAAARRGESVVGPWRRWRGGGERSPVEGGRVVAEEVVGRICTCAVREEGRRGGEGKGWGWGWVWRGGGGKSEGRNKEPEGVEENYCISAIPFPSMRLPPKAHQKTLHMHTHTHATPLPGPDLARAYARVMELVRVALQTSTAADRLRLLQLTRSEALAGPRPSGASVSVSARGRACTRARARYRHLSRRAGPHGFRGPEIGRSVTVRAGGESSSRYSSPKRRCNPVPSTRAKRR